MNYEIQAYLVWLSHQRTLFLLLPMKVGDVNISILIDSRNHTTFISPIGLVAIGIRFAAGGRGLQPQGIIG